MRASKSAAVLTWALVLGEASMAFAQRREGQSNTVALEVSLPHSLQFGDVTLAARRYRVSLTPQGLALSNPTTMVLVATVAVEEKAAATFSKEPVVTVRERGAITEVMVQIRDRLYLAKGRTTQVVKPKERPIALASKSELDLGQIVPEAKTERELVAQALQRYLRQVKHCADKARRFRWETDDLRFWRCVCPAAEKWRLPKIAHSIRIHQSLAKGRSGLSLTVLDSGKARGCRVWTGTKPPKDEVADGAKVDPKTIRDYSVSPEEQGTKP